MAEIRSIGLEYIKIGTPETDGSMSTNLAALGVTYQDTAELVRDDPEVTEIFSEENDEPEEVLESKGPARLRWSIMSVNPSDVVEILGGTANGNVYEAPLAKGAIEKSIEIKTKTGLVIQIPRTKIYAKENFQFRKKGVLLIDVEARILTPEMAGLAPIKWEQTT